MTVTPARSRAAVISAIARRPAITVAAAVTLVAAVTLMSTHHPPRLALARAEAIAAVRADPGARAILSALHWDSVSVSAVDRELERLSYFENGRIVAQVGVRHDGSVVLAEDLQHRRVPYGDWIAYQPAMLVGLLALFVLLSGVAPLRRMRNADVAATVSLVASVVLLEQRFVAASVLSALPGMVFLTLRCAWIGLGPGRDAGPSKPLMLTFLPQLSAPQRIRLLKVLLAVLALIYAMVGLSSPAAVDVIYGVMEGATKLVHGVLPYGHMPGDVIHGDTYPLFSYMLYAPVAWAAPVRSVWDSVDGALAVAVGAALVAGAALYRAVAGTARGAGEEESGLRAAIAFLAFPPLLIAVSAGTTDVVLAMMLAIALLAWRRPARSSAVLATAAWFKLAPAVLVPVWLAPLRGRRLAGALAALVAVSAAMLGLLAAVGGLGGPEAMVRAVGFQFSRGSPQSVWSVLGLGHLQPISEAVVLGLVAGAALKLRRDASLAEDRVRVAAIAAAILLALQLAAGYWSFLYTIWILPLWGLSLFADVPRPAGAHAGALKPVPALAGGAVRV